jgi:DNA-binding transcriptional MocR family regulator
MEGFILLHRKMLDNAIFYKADYYQIWSYILLKVNHKDTEIIWNGEKKILKKGSGIFSQKKISEELRISIGTVHNALKYLKSENQIEIKTTTKFTEIQVVKWEDYQDVERVSENRMKTKRKQNETDNNDNNDNNDNKIIGECQEFISTYGKEMIKAFLNHWLEKDKKGKSKWAKQETWETSKRLATWKANDLKWNKGKQVANGTGGAVI